MIWTNPVIDLSYTTLSLFLESVFCALLGRTNITSLVTFAHIAKVHFEIIAITSNSCICDDQTDFSLTVSRDIFRK